MASRETGRAKETGNRRVLDEAGRRRRARKALEALEQDNFHEDPHANLVMSKKAPKFEELLDSHGRSKERKRKTRSADYFKQRYRKNFAMLLEEDQLSNPDGPNYLTAQAGASQLPERHLCAVCGFPSPYNCVACGARYCSTRCYSTHQDTRCLKYTA
ncbi:zinc finger HIT domain-containing protein 1-like [Hyalella azteca]|uniref:Zinc finger HIT domain-containing protein 1-like n=2 Tax=Hyalella azteca TaxID=294128 RepID=A0A8B7PDI3_HYAAZ|nr:zinc finger HIT domain-containing protein 1-like [Hyalella azteca]